MSRIERRIGRRFDRSSAIDVNKGQGPEPPQCAVTFNNDGRADKLWLRHADNLVLEDVVLLGHLTEIVLANCGIITIEPLARLTELSKLNLGANNSNQIKDLRPLAHLVQLSDLNLSNNRISDLAPLGALTQLGNLVVSGNPIGLLPVDVALQGPAAICSYYQLHARQESKQLFEAKVLLVGEPGAGMTTLMHKLLDPKYPVPSPIRGQPWDRHQP